MSAPQILINGTAAVNVEPAHPQFIITHDLQTITEDEEVAGLNELKKMTTRLRLSTRRPSIMQWRENLTNFQQNAGLLRQNGGSGGMIDHDTDDESDNRSDDSDELSDDRERRKKIDNDIAWIKKELVSY